MKTQTNPQQTPVPATIDETTPVLIVGGGLTGLSTAVFLAWHGVKPLLVERHPDLLIHPRARGFTPRTMELYRQVGLEPAIRAASYAGGDRFEWIPVRAESLAGEYERVEEPAEEQGYFDASPAPFGAIDQDKLELLLRARAEELGADVRFSTEMTSFAQDDEGVTAVLKDRRSGAERTVRAAYLVAADGYGSPIRQRLGVETDGPGAFFHVLTIMFEADLGPAVRGRRFNIAYLQRPRPGTAVMALDEVGRRWGIGIGYSPDHGESPADFTDERCIQLIREATGLPDLAATIRPQIPGTDLKVLSFTIGAQVARRYRVGRVFIAGDAAHIMPPTGGLGANTGIQDAHNLAWKLAAVLRGQAGSALLDTYEAERHPIGLFTMGQSLARSQDRMGIGREGEAAPFVPAAAITFGYQYRSPAVLGAAADGAPALLPDELAGQPGTRAPHLWLERGGKRISTIDLFGRDFVLLTGATGGAWLEAARAVAARLGIELAGYQIGGSELTDPDDRWPAACGIAADGAILVRPDGFVGWRTEGAVAEPDRALEQALRSLLEREATGVVNQQIQY